jgi:iron complex outermembrane receptor protein
LALGAALSTESAVAQTQEDSGESSGALGEIVVTAERRPTDLQNTPISVMAYSGQALESRGVDSIDDISGVVPNTSFGGSNPNAGGAPDFAIRGVGQTSARPFSEKGVGLYIDDIYYPRAVGSFLNLGDVQRIEVLRGPQGTLFGRNTTGGAVRYFTKEPVHEFEAELSGTTGSFNRRDFNALLNVPLGDAAALRVQAASFYRDGYVDVIGREGRAYGDQEDYAARASLLIEPTDNFSIRLTGGYVSTSSLGDPIVIKGLGFLMPPPPAPPIVYPIIQAYNAFLTSQGQPTITAANDPRWVSPSDGAVPYRCILDSVPFVSANFVDNDPLRLSTAINQGDHCRERKADEMFFGSADIEWSLSDAVTIRSLTGYNKGSHIDWGDYGLFGASTNLIHNDNESFSQEFQLTGDTKMFDWVVGLYYFTESPLEQHYNRQLVLNPPPPAPPNPNFGACCTGFERFIDMHTDSYAVYGQGTLNPTERLALTAGFRYTYDEKEIVVTKTGIYSPNVPVAERVQTGANDWDALDWRATVSYDWTDDLMTYATWSRGFKSGGFNGDITVVDLDPSTPSPVGPFDYLAEPFEPEVVTNYEIGIRSEWFDNRFRANLTAFKMDFDSMVIQLADFTGGGLTLRSLNAGYVDLSGFEGEFEVAVVDNLSLFANFGYTDLEYEHLNNNSPLFFRAAGTACPTPPAVATFENCTAQKLTRTPEWTYSAGFDFSAIMAAGQLKVNGYYTFQDDIISNNSTQNSVVLPAHGVTNLRIEYDSLETWRIALFGTNVFDEAYYTAGFRGFFTNSTLPVDFRSPGRPQEWGVKLSLRL